MSENNIVLNPDNLPEGMRTSRDLIEGAEGLESRGLLDAGIVFRVLARLMSSELPTSAWSVVEDWDGDLWTLSTDGLWYFGRRVCTPEELNTVYGPVTVRQNGGVS